MNKNIKLYQCLIAIFIMAIGLISFGVAHTRALEVNENLTAELNNSQILLSTTENELNLTQENLLAETEKSNNLNESLKTAQAELENKIAELEIANTTIADLTSEEYEFVYMGNFKYTYYCDERYEHICGYGQGITASGKRTEVGWTVAADTSVLPMGSIIYIEGIGFREVMDRGGGVKGNHIDILMTTHNECFRQSIVGGDVWVLVKKEA